MSFMINPINSLFFTDINIIGGTGILDDLRIFNSSLNSSQIMNDYLTGKNCVEINKASKFLLFFFLTLISKLLSQY